MRHLFALPLLAAAATILAGTLAGCNTVGCTDNRNSLPLAGFYSTDGTPIAIDSLAVWGIGAIGADSLLLDPGVSSTISEIYMPLRSQATSAAFCFAYCSSGLNYAALRDTISFAYNSEPYFISEDCGAGFRYTIQRMSYTTHLIDSVALEDTIVTNANAETLRIFFRTADDDATPGEEGEL